MDMPAYETPAAAQSQERIDADHLNTLTLCHYIMHVIGAMMIHHPSAFLPLGPAYPAPQVQVYLSAPPYPVGASYPFFPPFMGYLFLTMGIIAVALGWTLGGLTAYAGRCLKRPKNSIFVFIVAGLNCAFVMPLGTILGAFTFAVLLRSTVKALFQRQ